MEYEKKYNDLIARINEVKEKPSLCMKEKHHYNGYVETGIRDALDYIVNPEGEDESIRETLANLIVADINELIKSADSRAYFQGVKEYLEDVRQFAYNKGLVDAKEKYQPAEWSEDDEKMHQALIHDLGVICEKDYPDNINLKKGLDWLKSLRSQPHWKPSEDLREYKQ